MRKIAAASFFYVFSLAVSPCWALSDIDISGELNATFEAFMQPTSEQGKSEFRIPSLFLDLNVPLSEGNTLFLQMEGAEQRSDSGTTRFDVRMSKAYFDLVSLFSGMYALRGGLIPQPWQQAEYEIYSYRFLGKQAWVITEKWKYLSYSDLGASFMAGLPADLGEWALSFSNGEGRDEKEQGPHKEAALFIRLTDWSPWTVSLNYVRGSYDAYGAEISLKERVQGLLAYRGENWAWGLELLSTTDPADALSDYKMADEVDVVSLQGESVQGLGGSLFVEFKASEKSSILLRYDYLNAVVGEEGKDQQGGLLAWAYQVTEDVRAAIAADYTHYGDQYFAFGGRERSRIEVATQILF